MAPAQQLAMPLPAAPVGAGALPAVEEEERASAGAQGQGAPTKASPAHMMMMGHAMIFGALSATKDVANHALQAQILKSAPCSART
jgi:hypothetical protein